MFDIDLTRDFESQESDGEKTDTQPKFTFGKIFSFLIAGSLLLAFLDTFVFLYFTFCGFFFLTIDLFIYSWLSIFTKEPLQIFLSILANFSDFGLFFALSLLTFSSIKLYSILINNTMDQFIIFLKTVHNTNKRDRNISKKFFFLFASIVSHVFFLFVIYKWIFYAAIVYEAIYLLITLSFVRIIIIKITKNESTEDISSNSESIDFNFINDYNCVNENNTNNDDENSSAFFTDSLEANDIENTNNENDERMNDALIY